MALYVPNEGKPHIYIDRGNAFKYLSIMQDIAFQLCLIKGVYKSQYHAVMFRNLAKLVARGAHRPLTTSTTPFMRMKQNVFFFSSTVRHPTIERIQCGVNTTNIGSILSDVQALEEEHQTTALRMIITKVQHQQVPVDVLLHQKFVTLSQKYPGVFIEGKIALTDLLIKQLEQLVLDQVKNHFKLVDILQVVNNSYMMCFEQVQKKVKEAERWRYKIILNKKYSDFYLIYFAKYVDPKRKQEDFKLCADIYRKDIQRLKVILKNIEGTLSKTTDNSSKLKKDAFGFLEMCGQNVLYLNQIASEIHKINNNKNQLKKRCSESVKNIEGAIEQFRIVQELIPYSAIYNQLKKIKLQTEYYLVHQQLVEIKSSEDVLENLKKGMAIELGKLHDEFMKRYQQMLVEGKDKSRVCKSALALLMVKTEQLDKEERISLEKYKEKLQQEIQIITSKIGERDLRMKVRAQLDASLDYIMRTNNSKAKQSSPLDGLI